MLLASKRDGTEREKCTSQGNVDWIFVNLLNKTGNPFASFPFPAYFLRKIPQETRYFTLDFSWSDGINVTGLNAAFYFVLVLPGYQKYCNIM